MVENISTVIVPTQWRILATIAIIRDMYDVSCNDEVITYLNLKYSLIAKFVQH